MPGCWPICASVCASRLAARWSCARRSAVEQRAELVAAHDARGDARAEADFMCSLEELLHHWPVHDAACVATIEPVDELAANIAGEQQPRRPTAIEPNLGHV